MLHGKKDCYTWHWNLLQGTWAVCTEDLDLKGPEMAVNEYEYCTGGCSWWSLVNTPDDTSCLKSMWYGGIVLKWFVYAQVSKWYCNG